MLIDDYVLYVSLYQDGFTASNDKNHTEVVSIKINDIPVSLFRNDIFNPISFISSSADSMSLLKCFVDFETVLGRHGLYIHISGNNYIRLRYSIEAVDGDSVAQFKMLGIGSNTCHCPCFFGCYKKRYNIKMSSFSTVNLLQQ